MSTPAPTKTKTPAKAKAPAKTPAGPRPAVKDLLDATGKALSTLALAVIAWWGLSVMAVLVALPGVPLIPNPVWLLAGGTTVILLALAIVQRARTLWWRARGGAHTARAPKDARTADDAWWDHLDAALRAVGVLPAARADAPPVSARALGGPASDERGVQQVVELPRATGKSWRDVAGKQENLAAALGLDNDRVEISAGAHAGQVRVWVADERPDTGPVPCVLTGATSSVWHEPLRIGETMRGVPVRYTTWGANGLFAGIMGSGKTVAARQVAAHFLLDPTAVVHIFDGKGSRSDWGAAEPACSTFVLGAEEQALATIEKTMTSLLALCKARNAAANPDRDDSWRPEGVLLIVDEVQEILAALPRDQREALEVLFARVLRMGRAVGVHSVFVTQRPTVDDLPSAIRNVLQERVALMARNVADLDLALGSGGAGVGRHPKAKGEALVTGGGSPVFTRLDYLADPAWRALCAHAATTKHPAPVSMVKALPAGPAVDPMVAAALAVLDASEDGTLSPADLHAALPEQLRPTDATVMGKALTAAGVAKKKTSRGVRYGTARAPGAAVTGAVTVPSLPKVPSPAPVGVDDGTDWPPAWDEGVGDGSTPHPATAPPRAPTAPEAAPRRSAVTPVIATREQRAQVPVCELRAGQRVRFDDDPDPVTIHAAGIDHDDDDLNGQARWWVTYAYDGEAPRRYSLAGSLMLTHA